MPYQLADLEKIDAAILSGVKAVTFADGRKTEFHSLDEMRRLRADIKTELQAAGTMVVPRTRSVVARVRRP